MTRVSAILLAVGLALCPTAVSAAPDGVRAYGRRIEALFVRMDANRDGRLELHEVRGQPYLERRVLRRDSPGFLRMEDLRGPAGAPSGQRLQRRFRQADRNGDGRLDREEVRRLPWLARHFQSLDLNQDGGLTLAELWLLQRALAPRPQP
jgi:hypothetical protein